MWGGWQYTEQDYMHSQWSVSPTLSIHLWRIIYRIIRWWQIYIARDDNYLQIICSLQHYLEMVTVENRRLQKAECEKPDANIIKRTRRTRTALGCFGVWGFWGIWGFWVFGGWGEFGVCWVFGCFGVLRCLVFFGCLGAFGVFGGYG